MFSSAWKNSGKTGLFHGGGLSETVGSEDGPDSANRLPFHTIAAPASDAAWEMAGEFPNRDYRWSVPRKRSRVAASRLRIEMPDLFN
jgi:hypothetical protein